MKSHPLYRILILLIVPLLLNANVFGQIDPITPHGVMDTVLDRLGNKYHLLDLAVNDTVRGYDTLIINKTCNCDPGYFKLFFEPGSGMEDDTIAVDTLRRNTLCRVLKDLSQFIHSPLTNNGGKINIWVRNPNNVALPTGAEGYGTSFYHVPSIASISGISDNITWITLHSGTDGYTNVASPQITLSATTGATFFHALLAFDFSTYTWHTDLTASPSSGDYDLYSIALREISHTLGISSAINNNGSSILSANFPYYSRYDKFLKSHSGIPLLANTGGISLYNYAFNTSGLSTPGNVMSPNLSSCVTDSTDCDTAVQYDGSVTIPVYTPNCFELGFSLGNFEDQCTGTPDPANNNLYFVASNLTFTGSMKRYLKAEERSVLCDIGYTIDTVYGDTTNLNYYHYGSTVCDGISVAGINDGYVDGAYAYTSSMDGSIQINGTGLPSGVNGLLDNDVNANSFEGLEVLTGSGTLNATSGGSTTVVKYTPVFGEHDPILLRYVPYNSITGERGNITYASMLVSYDSACPYTSCELVINGNFAEATHCGVIEWDIRNSDTIAATICSWTKYANSPDLYRDDCGVTIYALATLWNPTIPFTGAAGPDILDPAGDSSGKFIGIYAGRKPGYCSEGKPWATEALKTHLAAPLIPGAKYKLHFDARVVKDPPSTELTAYHDVVIQFYVSTGDPGTLTTIPSDCSTTPLWLTPSTYSISPFALSVGATPLVSAAGHIVIADLPVSANSWHDTDLEFTYTGPAAAGPGMAQWLTVMSQPQLTAVHNSLPTTTGSFLDYVLITNVSITPKIELYFPVVSCTPVTLHPDSIVMDSGGTYPLDTFSWLPTGGVSCTPCYSPTTTAIGMTIYTVTESYYGCVAYDTVTIFPPVTATASSSAACVGDLVSLFGTATGTGPLTLSWTRIGGGFTSTAEDTSFTATVAGTFSYIFTVTDTNGCSASDTTIVTVLPMPTAITGTYTVCAGATASLISTPLDGTWTSSNTAVATVVSPGTWTGVSAGTATITYTFGGTCYVTVNVTVYASPATITGPSSLCEGSTITLACSTPGGVWSSTNTAVATVNSSGVVTGLSGGTTIISYTMPGGCASMKIVTVYALPVITGSMIICTASPGVLTTTIGGGTWLSGTTSVATIASIGSFAALVTGVSSGTSVITYTAPTGCEDTAVVTIVVSPEPITGILVACEGDTTYLSDASIGGTWTSGAPGIATVSSTGMVIGVSAGTATISYTTDGLCYATDIVTVNPIPGIIPFPSLCTGDTLTLLGAPSGGTWISSDPAVATIGASSGFATALIPGTTTITYTLSTGCYSTEVMHVNLTPTPIFGTFELCQGDTTTLYDTTIGGTWSCSPAFGIISIDPSTGHVVALAAGVATVIYTLGGCTATALMTINPVPSITPFPSLCTGDTLTLHGLSAGGTWISSNTAVATIGVSSGSVTAITPGTTLITYTLSTGCYTTAILTVNLTPTPIFGTFGVCLGSTVTIYDTTVGGTWVFSGGSITIIAAGDSAEVTGVVPGTVVVSYVMPSGCMATAIMTVSPLPKITGDSVICVLDTTTLTGSIPGGTWTSGAPAVATIGLSSGLVTGVSAGTTTITYVTPAGCSGTKVVTVNPIPSPIIGDTSICWESSTILTDTTLGGTWYVDGVITIPIDDSILISGTTVGTVAVSYVLPTGCGVSVVVAINPLPIPTSGTWILCGAGATTTFAATPAGGTWTSSDPAVATIDAATGAVTTLTTGTTAITYMLPTGCYYTNWLHVNPPPEPLDPVTLCVGEEISLISLPPGGTWSSSTPTVADIVSWVGILEGISVGTTTITYFLYGTGGSYTPGLSCYTTTTATVVTVPVVAPITGFDTICVFSSDTLFDATPGGFWTSGDPSVAPLVIGPPTPGQIIGGLSPGTALISYTVTNECGPTTVVHLVTVIDTPDVSISGVLGVCSEYTTTLTGTPAGGTWSSSNPTIATVDVDSGIVYGVMGGSVIISYFYTGPCGTTITTTNVLVNMAPYITANFITACQTLSGTGSDVPTTTISSWSGCMLVCDSSIVRYYGHGVAGSAYTWDISGGTVVTDWGDSIDVLWTTVGLIGSITLHDTFHHCIDSARACIKVIDKPDAYFTVPGPNFCLGSNVIFTDYSTGDPLSPIVYWHWNFGDGFSSSASGSAEHIYATSGTYTVTLTVRNACNCADSFKVVIEIDRNSGPDIYCPSIVCDSSYYTYSTSAICGTYTWSVTGGTIISGAGTASIKVKWDVADSSGFGYVTLYTPSCGPCSAPTTIKVPIILQNPEIAGPDSICTDRQYEYSFPLWPATDYMWGVLGAPGAIPLCHNDYKVVVNFNVPGTYVLHGWYQNRITLCGGNIFDTITVLPPTAIVGTTRMCAGAIETYSLTGSYSGNWYLVDYTTTPVDSTAGSGTFTHTFSTSGVYVLYATGDFCADPLTITVLPIPPAVDSIFGDDSVCLGRFYTYKALFNEPGYIYQWEAIGGTVSPATGNIVTAQWTSTGTKTLKVRRVAIAYPHCPGPQLDLDIMEEQITPNVTGEIYPCANTYHNYSANYNRAEVYDWKIIPNTAGSVVTGNHSADMQALWNHTAVAITASVVATVRKCDTEVSDTMEVFIDGAPVMAITYVSEDTICPHSTVDFTATAGAYAYRWDYGDGATETTLSNTASHAYGVNTTSSDIIYHVTVESDYSPGFCNPGGIGTADITVLPGPTVILVHIDSLSPHPCDTLLVRAITSNNVSITSYSWAGSHAALNDTTYLVYANETVILTVTAANGCTASDSFKLFPCVTLDCPPTVRYNVVANCNSATLNAITSSPGIWRTWDGTLAVPVSPPATDPAVAVFTHAGIYTYQYDSTFCHLEEAKVYVYAIPEFRWSIKCGTGGFDTVFLYDNSSYLPGVTGVTTVWYDVAATTTFSPAYRLVPSGTFILIGLQILGSYPGGTFNCYVEHSISVPAALTVSFSIVSTPLCTQVPMILTPITTGVPVSYFWDFDDGAYLLLANAKREFTFDPFGFNPNLRDVKLKVRDSKGCVASDTQTVEIYPNLLNGDLGLDTTICSSSAPITLSYFPALPAGSTPTPTAYLWSTGETTPTKSVYQSGAYWVTVFDGYQCQKTRPIPVKNVKVIETPPAVIHGQHQYCFGESFLLNGFVGDSVDYRWFEISSGPLTGFTHTPTYFSYLPSVDTYYYWLVTSIIDSASGRQCYDTSALDTVNVYGLPAPPTITGPTVLDCGLYYLQLTASEPVPGTFNWMGASTTGPVYNIDHGGPFRVWFTDLHGCVNHEDINVPLAPSTYMPYFPKGCYSLCEDQLPLVLNGPPCTSFSAWAWLKDLGIELSGGPGSMASYPITGSGAYQWVLNNGLCDDTSAVMDVDVIECNGCQGIGLTALLECDTTDPASYVINVGFNSYYAGTHYVLGTDIGPITPFSGTIAGTGAFTATLTFTTLLFSPLPDSVTVMLILTLPDGDKCYAEIRVPLDTCHWIAERGTVRSPSYSGGIKPVTNAVMNSALLVFPNPASGDVTISYDYGSQGSKSRQLSIYDIMGRKMGQTAPEKDKGTWNVDINTWAGGMYIIRMEGDGLPLQTARVIITH